MSHDSSQSSDKPKPIGLGASSEDPVGLHRLVEQAFAYRGNVTIDLRNGISIVCYLSNRDGRGPRPRVEYLDEGGEGPFSVPYSDIVNIRFTGADAAAATSSDTHQRRQAEHEAEAGDNR